MARLVFLAALLWSCVPTSASRPAPDVSVADMLSSTVQIHVSVVATLTAPDGSTEQLGGEWSGSGVVYAQTDAGSLILTAHHVLDLPTVGHVVVGPEGSLRIDEVLFTVLTSDGRTCLLMPLVLGGQDDQDVATGLADCHAGRVADLALELPARGERVVITGHPLGVPVAVATDGYVSGLWEGLLLVSAAAAPGNSGGPVWHNGQVVGLLVQGATKYSHISLVAPLAELRKRIAETAAVLQ